MQSESESVVLRFTSAEEETLDSSEDDHSLSSAESRPRHRHRAPIDDKHLSYYLHVMAETRTSNFFWVAKDMEALFCESTEKICESIGTWKNIKTEIGDGVSDDDEEDLQFLKNENNPSPEEDQPFTQFGNDVIKMGEILGRLLDLHEDTLLFQSPQALDKTVVLAKDLMKLKRKLMRISGTIMPDLKVIRDLVVQHGLLSPPVKTNSEDDDENDDTVFLNDDGSVTNSVIMELFSKQKDLDVLSIRQEHNGRFRRWFTWLQNIFWKKNTSSEQWDTVKGTISGRSASEAPSSTASTNQNQKSLERHDEGPEIKQPSEHPSNKTLQKIATFLRNPERKNLLLLNAPPEDPTTSNGIPVDKDEIENLRKLEMKQYKLDGEMAKRVMKTSQNDIGKKPKEVNLEKELHKAGIDLISKQGEPTTSAFTSSNLKGKEEDSSILFSEYITLVTQMHTRVEKTIEQVREIERSWLQTSTSAAGFKNFLKIGDMLDYIRETVNLLNDATFNAQLYPDTKDNVLNALEKVYREFHSCYLALSELAEIVSTDAVYLKELLEKLPNENPTSGWTFSTSEDDDVQGKTGIDLSIFD